MKIKLMLAAALMATVTVQANEGTKASQDLQVDFSHCKEIMKAQDEVDGKDFPLSLKNDGSLDIHPNAEYSKDGDVEIISWKKKVKAGDTGQVHEVKGTTKVKRDGNGNLLEIEEEKENVQGGGGGKIVTKFGTAKGKCVPYKKKYHGRRGGSGGFGKKPAILFDGLLCKKVANLFKKHRFNKKCVEKNEVADMPDIIKDFKNRNKEAFQDNIADEFVNQSSDLENLKKAFPKEKMDLENSGDKSNEDSEDKIAKDLQRLVDAKKIYLKCKKRKIKKLLDDDEIWNKIAEKEAQENEELSTPIGGSGGTGVPTVTLTQ